MSRRVVYGLAGIGGVVEEFGACAISPDDETPADGGVAAAQRMEGRIENPPQPMR
jgi:hypothetical protein